MAKIQRFPGYDFLACGHVVSHIKKTPRVLSPIKMGEYVGLQLVREDGSSEKQYLHRLICEAFHGKCPDGMECRHIDGDRLNNSSANLAWGTKQENEIDKKNHGTTPRGEKNPMAKLTPFEVQKMRAERSETGDSYAKIAKRFGVSTMTAFRAITGQSWGEW